MNDFVILDSDSLWRPEFNNPENHYREFMETWLAMCVSIGQSSRQVMLFGAGTGVPENIEPCVQRRYFSKVHYLALVCDGDLLEQRLIDRPDWRGCKIGEFIQTQKNFNRWFKEYDNSCEPYQIDLLDTTHETVEELAQKVKQWSSMFFPALAKKASTIS